MNYKEKYKQALEIAKECLQDGTIITIARDYILEIFPELQESKDERIRKEIIDFLRLPHPQFVGKRDHEKWIAWLEKQGKEEYALKSFKDEDIRKFMQYIEKQAKAYEFNFPNRGYDIYAFAKDILYWLEKQCNNKECGNEWKVITGLYKCTKRMFDGSTESRLLFEVGNLYKCIKIHKCVTNNDIAEFEDSYGHTVFLTDSIVREHFIKAEDSHTKF